MHEEFQDRTPLIAKDCIFKWLQNREEDRKTLGMELKVTCLVVHKMIGP